MPEGRLWRLREAAVLAILSALMCGPGGMVLAGAILAGTWTMEERERREFIERRRRERRCASCGYDLRGARIEPDGCRVCAECGAAWLVERPEGRVCPTCALDLTSEPRLAHGCVRCPRCDNTWWPGDLVDPLPQRAGPTPDRPAPPPAHATLPTSPNPAGGPTTEGR